MKKSSWFLLLAGLLAFAAPAFPAAKPNILVILADDLGYGELSCQGYTTQIPRGTEKVNNISYTTEAFGQEAIKFIQKHSAGPWFCYLPFNAVHAPLESTDKYLSRFNNVEDRRRHTFCAMLSAMDDAVGAV